MNENSDKKSDQRRRRRTKLSKRETNPFAMHAKPGIKWEWIKKRPSWTSMHKITMQTQ